jgi:precorrin-2 dehydrogenase/sirohydrochlorin ferrochelatase
MRYYPIFLNVTGRRCVVVGGGRVAERKVLTLLRAGASVQVISPAVTPRLALLATKKKIGLTRRVYRRGDLKRRRAPRPMLVFAATDDPATQSVVQKDGEALGALVNVADDARNSSFIVPASFAQGDLVGAISTSGASPTLARLLREELRRALGPKYRGYVRFLRDTRQQVRGNVPRRTERAKVLRQLAGKQVLEWWFRGAPRGGADLRKGRAKRIMNSENAGAAEIAGERENSGFRILNSQLRMPDSEGRIRNLKSQI